MKTTNPRGPSFLQTTFVLLLGWSLSGGTGSVRASGDASWGASGYLLSNLVSDQAGQAPFLDANLVNPWGILAGPLGRLIVADNHAGMATFYHSSGQSSLSRVVIPAPGGGLGAPTDLDWNWAESGFVIRQGKHRRASTLLFVTEDGTIAGWNRELDAGQAVIAVDNSAAGAIYKSMALGGAPHAPRLYAANFGQGTVEMYDRSFHWLKSFTDATLASAGFVPFGLRVIGGHVWVTYAFKAAPDDGDETVGAGLGYVDEFDLGGNLLRRFASEGSLNAPWGLALAPHRFGKFGGALLVGNFGDGTINAYQRDTGAFLGQLADSQGGTIRIEGLWGLVFGPGPTGASLYFTAGPEDEDHGLLGVIRPQPRERGTER